MRRNRWTWAAAATGAVVGMVSLTACGSGGGTADNASGESSTQKVVASIADTLPASLKSAGVIRVATDPTYPPFESETTSGDLEGFDIDLAKAVGETLGVKVDFVNLPFDAIIPGLAANKADLAMSALGDSKEREATVDFVTYYWNGTLALVKKGNPMDLAADTLCGARVGVLRGSLQQSTFLPAEGPKCEGLGKAKPAEVVYQNSSQAHLGLQSGRADAVLEDAPVVRDIATKQSTVFEAVGPFMRNPNPGGVALPQGSELLEPVQKAIDHLIETGAYAAILKKWGLQDIGIEASVKNGAQS